jgi:hypothetical protein
MQQYQNPNFYGQQQFMQPQFNPYMQRMENLQQFQQAIQQPMVPTSMSGANQFNTFGKIVESMDIVKVTDIPMDGNMYYFPQADGQAIYGKKFLPNGQTQILTFKPSLESEPNNVSTETEKSKFDALEQFLEGIQNEVRTLSDKIDKISKPIRAKKEVEDE